MADLDYEDVHMHVFNRFPDIIHVDDTNIENFLECPCWREFDKTFGHHKFV